MGNRGLCSRRDAEALIVKGQVRVDGAVARLGMRVPVSCHVSIEARAQRTLDAAVSVVLHKPFSFLSQARGCACA